MRDILRVVVPADVREYPSIFEIGTSHAPGVYRTAVTAHGGHVSLSGCVAYRTVASRDQSAIGFQSLVLICPEGNRRMLGKLAFPKRRYTIDPASIGAGCEGAELRRKRRGKNSNR